MARIQLKDLPLEETLDEEALKGLRGGAVMVERSLTSGWMPQGSVLQNGPSLFQGFQVTPI